MKNNSYPSLIKTVLEEKIKDNVEDIELLKIEVEKLKDEMLSSERRVFNYSQKNHFGIMQVKLLALESEINKLLDENQLFKLSFTDEMIQDLDYIFQMNKTPWPKALAGLVIDTRLDLVMFQKSQLSVKDYERDVKNIRKKLKELNSFLLIMNVESIPELPHKVIQNMVFFIEDEMMTRYTGIQLFPQSAIKDIVSIISERRYMPRAQKEFNRKHFKYLYSIEPEEMVDFIRKNEDDSS